MSMQCICIMDKRYLLQIAFHLYLDISGGRQKRIYYLHLCQMEFLKSAE